MRINRLDLLRYGRFNEAAIAFPRPAEGPDVTLVYGPNEAGKSTAFHGYLDLLFGFKPGAHPYAFRFKRNELLIGAELELPGLGPLTLRRNGKTSGSLVDAEGRALSDAQLLSALHGLTREGYEERFSLNDRGLREGGARIAAANGDLGQLLHAGVSGLTGMAAALDALAARADRFHKKHGRATELKKAKDRLVEIGRERRASLLTREREQALQQARDRAQAAFDKADQHLRQADRTRAAAEGVMVWLAESARVADLEAELALYPTGPSLAPGLAEEVAHLVETLATLTEAKRAAEAEETRVRARLEAHPEDPTAAALAAELARLDAAEIDGASLLSRATTAQADLARRQASETELTQKRDALLAELAIAPAEAAHLQLPQAEIDALADCLDHLARTELRAEAARAAADNATAHLGEAPPEPRNLSPLRRASEALTQIGDLSLPEASRNTAAARLANLTALLPQAWPEAVAVGLPPREQIEALAQSCARLAAEITTAETEHRATAQEHQSAEEACDALAALPDAVDLAATETSRRARDMAWQRHLDALSATTAAEFSEAMAEDDSARAHYLLGAEARQRLAQAQAQAAQAARRLERSRQRLSDLQTQQDAAAMQTEALARALLLPPDSPVAALAPRHQALSAAAEATADLHIAEADLTRQQALRAAAEAALAAEAEALDLPLAEVDRSLALEDTTRAAFAKWQRDHAEVAKRAEAAEAATRAVAEAAQELSLKADGLPLPDRSAVAIRTALPTLRRLAQVLTEHRQITARITALASALETLATSAARLQQLCGETDQAEGDPLAQIDAARARHEAAERSAEIRAEALSQLEAATQAAEAASAKLAQTQDALAACFHGQAGEDQPPLARINRLNQRDSLRATQAEALRRRDTARARIDAELFDAELARQPDPTRPAALEQARAEAEAARDQARDTLRDADQTYRAAFDTADRSDLATEEATLLEDLRQGARSAIVARLGGLAARGALRQLAQERRSTMLQDVERAFVQMTAPNWTGVDVWSEAEGEKLVGIQPGGAHVPVSEMSTGTMGQLYFALRLAGYRGFAQTPGPLPMILDDIMETFDDLRARAALTLCAEIGSVGQAVLFTHHAHLVELAEQCLPGVAVVEMPR